MKNAFSALLLVALFIGISMGCKKDDEVNPDAINGTWNLYELRGEDGVSTTTLFGEVFTYEYKFYGEDFDATTTFTESPNTFESEGTYTAVTITDVNGVIDTTFTPLAAFDEGGTWFIEGNTFHQVLLGDTTEFEILELNDDKFRLRNDLDISFTDPLTGATTHDEATVFISWEK